MWCGGASGAIISTMTQRDAGPTASSTSSRRAVLAALLASAASAACTSRGFARDAARPCRVGSIAPTRSFDATFSDAAGRALCEDEVLASCGAASIVLLGEWHDAPAHHGLRGRWVAALGRASPRRRVILAAEHLTRPSVVDWSSIPRSACEAVPESGHRADAPDLLSPLRAAGFDARAWGWPLHQSLFSAAACSQLPTVGANLPAQLARRIAREGAAALPSDIAAAIAASPLPASAEQTLLDDLRDGHCGRIEGPRLQRMLLAQRARDAAMALSVLQALETALRRPEAMPLVLLVAGNGHVRRDLGVPTLLTALRPDAHALAIGFGETSQAPSGRFDVVVRTPDHPRPDPCAAFDRPAAPVPG